MGLTYNKKGSKDRLILPRGPRDLQRRQLQQASVDGSQEELLESLRSQIKLLQDQLNSSTVSDKELNDEIADVIKKETAKHRERINILENENSVLKSTIQNSEILIGQLKQIKMVDTESSVYNDPEIDPVFVDPIEKDLEPVESHIEVETGFTMGKKDISDKVSKLKDLLGKM